MSHECIKPSGTCPQHINKVETMRMGQLTLKDRNLPNPLANKNTNSNSSSFVSFTHFFPTCGRMPLPALSLWPGRQPYRPRLVGDRRGGGPSSEAPRSRNPPTERRQDSPISSSLFSHSPPLCAVGQGIANRASPLQIQPAKIRPPPVLF